ncbi:MAG: NAD(P)-binding domain-containing protein, partial [Elusimicrobiota bacterium]|nr:NAD(P)-binding domain-containing protein [Elusimicrobiota bacterium]
MKIGFIGAGRAGVSLGNYFKASGLEVAGYFSKNYPAASAFNFKKYKDIASLASSADLIFIATPDDQIPPVWAELKKQPLKGKIICHLSGAKTSAIFKGIEKTGAAGFSTHPLFVFNNYKTPLKKVYFTVEGNG